MGSRQKTNKKTGDSFEDLFKRQAQFNGLLALKNHLTARFVGAGNVKIVKSELDFKLINQNGDVGYFDCKSFESDYFVYSQIDSKQLERAALYNEWNVPSGFVIWLRKVNTVLFITGKEIQLKGERTRFTRKDGQRLGSYENFDLKVVLKRSQEGAPPWTA